jgi:hypothetical protein
MIIDDNIISFDLNNIKQNYFKKFIQNKIVNIIWVVMLIRMFSQEI